jgi:four helix bundle protein
MVNVPCDLGPSIAVACGMIGDELRARTRQFALDVIGLCLKLGRDDVGRLIAPQLLRSGTGVAANHRAAGQSRSRREFVSRLSVVIEESEGARRAGQVAS